MKNSSRRISTNFTGLKASWYSTTPDRAGITKDEVINRLVIYGTVGKGKHLEDACKGDGDTEEQSQSYGIKGDAAADGQQTKNDEAQTVHKQIKTYSIFGTGKIPLADKIGKSVMQHRGSNGCCEHEIGYNFSFCNRLQQPENYYRTLNPVFVTSWTLV